MGESGEFKTSGRQVTLFKQMLRDDNTATKNHVDGILVKIEIERYSNFKTVSKLPIKLTKVWPKKF